MDIPAQHTLSTKGRRSWHALGLFGAGLIVCALGCGAGDQKTTKDPGPATPELPLQGDTTAKASITFLEPAHAQRYLRARIDIIREDGTLAADARLDSIEPWMTIHGHPSATGRLKFAASASQPGSFDVEGLYFIMAGPWDLKLKGSVAGTQGDRQAVAITLPVDVLP